MDYLHDIRAHYDYISLHCMQRIFWNIKLSITKLLMLWNCAPQLGLCFEILKIVVQTGASHKDYNVFDHGKTTTQN